MQVDQRQQPVAQAQHRRAVDAFDSTFVGFAAASSAAARTSSMHADLRDGEALAAGFDDQRRDDGQRQRDLDGEGRALARARSSGRSCRRCARYWCFTTSMPTPRPDTAVTSAAVEKPARKMKRWICASVMAASSASLASPLCERLGADPVDRRPRPSSAISMMMWPPSWIGVQRDVPGLGLAGGARARPASRAVVGRVAHHVGQRVLDQLQHLAVELGLGAVHHQLDLLAQVAGAGRARCRGSLFQALPIGCMRVFMTPSCRSEVMCDSRCSGTAKSLFSCVRAAAAAGCGSAPAR